jgi:LysR family transcriptional regulator, glycine cleavage system transcriptional activator
MRRLPPTRALEAFLATARAGTLKGASEELNLSVSALSRRVQGLEAHIGQPLFERRHHEFRLTGIGERLQAGMEPVFDHLAILLEELRDEGRYHLHIGVPSAFATAWLMPRLNGFRARFPAVELHLDSAGSPLSKLGVSLDAIVYFANRDETPINVQELRPQRAFAVAAPGLVDTRSGLQKALRDHPLLLHSGLPEILPCWLREVGRSRASTQRIEYFDDGALLVSAAENGLGIALVLEDMVNFYPRTATIVRPFGECAPTPYSYCLGTKLASGSGRALHWFRDWLLEEAEQDVRSLVRAPEAA